STQRQPHTALWLDQVDSGRWNEIVSTGPSQSGKSLLCYVLPILYHLFELRENVICGLPSMDMADEKYAVDIEPAIRASRYEMLLPRSGPGSKGGSVAGGKPVRFGNGTTLKFMSGGGKDKSRAGSTARVLVITETDGLDEAGTTSREADKIKQLEARLRAYGDRRMLYKECTVSIEQGHTWKKYQQSPSRIVVPCPRCLAWVSPEREHLQGWQNAETELEARERAHFCCPACGAAWTAEERIAAAQQSRLLLAGQSIDAEGQIVGEPQQTRTFGFRWSAFNNLFTTPAQLGAEEWHAARAENTENAEKEMRQFIWCLPYEPPALEIAPLDYQVLKRRFGDWPKGLVPAAAEKLSLGLDLGKRVGYWALASWMANGSGHICDYGTIDIPSDDLGQQRAMQLALREFRDRVLTGWTHESGGVRVPDIVLVDAGYQKEKQTDTPVVYEFLKEQDTPRSFRPVIGRGVSTYQRSEYRRPKKTGAEVKLIGEDYHVVWSPRYGIFLVEANADAWKLWLWEGLRWPLDQPGAITLYTGSTNEHITFTKHLTAEHLVEEFVAGKGLMRRWEQHSRANHYLDASYYACVGGHFVGARRIKPAVQAAGIAPAGPSTPAITTPDGRPYLITER
ncbi:MAG: terminase gpA endonuclease subunit, partial [Planctomycetota bacterium]